MFQILNEQLPYQVRKNPNSEDIRSFLRKQHEKQRVLRNGYGISALSVGLAATAGCVGATNTNGDKAGNIADATYLLNHLFSGGRAPVDPFPDCGPGTLPADTELGCANPPDC